MVFNFSGLTYFYGSLLFVPLDYSFSSLCHQASFKHFDQKSCWAFLYLLIFFLNLIAKLEVGLALFTGREVLEGLMVFFVVDAPWRRDSKQCDYVLDGCEEISLPFWYDLFCPFFKVKLKLGNEIKSVIERNGHLVEIVAVNLSIGKSNVAWQYTNCLLFSCRGQFEICSIEIYLNWFPIGSQGPGASGGRTQIQTPLWNAQFINV